MFATIFIRYVLTVTEKPWGYTPWQHCITQLYDYSVLTSYLRHSTFNAIEWTIYYVYKVALFVCAINLINE